MKYDRTMYIDSIDNNPCNYFNNKVLTKDDKYGIVIIGGYPPIKN